MASAKRKQDEKNLKTLRELVSQPGNKECFDCHQRGPTYVNMTIGSFVCTSCSGMLRGLTPPHRVKSISMATFTPAEIHFIKQHGNAYCKKVWLGLMDHGNCQSLDIKDEQQMKDLMSAKYELKRYYLEPSTGGQDQQVQEPTRQLETSNVPRVPMFGTSVTPGSVNRGNSHTTQNTNEFVPEFKADFSKTPDLLSNITSSEVKNPLDSAISQPFFANFDNNFTLNTQKSFGMAVSLPQQITENLIPIDNKNGTYAPPSEDRYAALKDLDSLMKQTHIKEQISSTATQHTWNTNNIKSAVSGAGNQTANVISNPFISTDFWQPSANVINNNPHPLDSPSCHSGNPFKAISFGINSDSQQLSIGSSNTGDIIQVGQLTPPISNKVWQPNLSSYHVNPFTVGTTMSGMARNSNNPFL